MTDRARLLIVASLALATICFCAPGFSGATFTSRTTNTLSSVTAASDWTPPTVTLVDPGSLLSGSNVTITATASDADSGVESVFVQYAPSGSNTWTTLCTDTTSPYQCTWNTKTVADGSYQLRATATDNAGYSAAAVRTVAVDNTAPSVTMQIPHSPLRGTVTLGAAVGDANSGVAKVDYQYTVAGGTSWTTACTATAAPFTCTFDTKEDLSDRRYDLRAVATDVAGNATTSVSVPNLPADNTAAVSLTVPAYLGGTVTVPADVSSAYGVANVVLTYAAHGSSSFTAICTAATAPYSCASDTRLLPNGRYDVEAVLTDNAGLVLTSALATATISNTPPTAASVRTTNVAGGTAGTLEPGDTLTYTYNGLVDPGSLLTGWDGSPGRSVMVQALDGHAVGGNQNKDDTLRLSGVDLGEVNMGADLVAKDATMSLPATMGWAIVGDKTVVTVTFGRPPTGNIAIGSGAPKWTPSATAKSYAGTSCSTSSVGAPPGSVF